MKAYHLLFDCESLTNLRLTQNKGKESENSYQKLKSSQWTGTQKQNRNISTDMAVFLNQKRANVCEHTTKTISLEFLKGATRELREEWMEGNLKGDYLRALSRGQNELVCKFKMAVDDKVSIKGQVMEYTYIPTGIKRELVRSGVDSDWMG